MALDVELRGRLCKLENNHLKQASPVTQQKAVRLKNTLLFGEAIKFFCFFFLKGFDEGYNSLTRTEHLMNAFLQPDNATF